MTDPNAPRLFRLRCTYIEQGRLAMLSHLEVARALERTVRRAGLPFAVSQGFSPHMRISFGAALPVGVGSTCEIFDVLLTDYVPDQEALAALKAASVPDLMVQACRYVQGSAPAASVAFPVSTYEVLFDREVGQVCVPDTITIVRKRKEKTLCVSEYLVGPFEAVGDRARFSLEAKPTGSLRPDVLLEHCGLADCVVSVTRVGQR